MTTTILGRHDPVPLRRPKIAEVAWVRALTKLKVGGKTFPAGTRFDAAEVRAIFLKHDNFWSLVQTRAIQYGLSSTPEAPAAPAGSQMIVVNAGFGKYDVIEGRVVAKGLTKVQATAYLPTPPAVKPDEKKSDAA